MGCDIQLFCEGYLDSKFNKGKKWINIDHWYRQDGWAEYMATDTEGFDYINLIDNNRDYGLFYLLAGVRGFEDEESYPPIAKPKGLPEQMDLFIKRYMEKFYDLDFEHDNIDVHDASYLSLLELKNSGYGNIMTIRGWVKDSEYEKSLSIINEGEKYQLNFVDEKRKDADLNGLVLREWNGYLNLNLTFMIERMEKLKQERNIVSDDDIRIVFWFDN